MIKSKFFISILSISTFVIFIISCHSCNQKDKGIEFVDVEQTDIDSALNLATKKFAFASKGPVWQTWN